MQNAHQGALPALQHVLTLCCTAGSEAVYEGDEYAVNERWLAASQSKDLIKCFAACYYCAWWLFAHVKMTCGG